MLLQKLVLLVTIYRVTSLTVQEAGQFFNSRRYGGFVSVSENVESYIVSSNGLPDHQTEPVNPNKATPRSNVLIVPKAPTVAELPGCLRQGPIAVTRTGVMIFNPLNAGRQNAVEGSTAEKFDSCDGHADPQGIYHYHKIPKSCMYKGEEDEFIGVALDGFPIYGPLASDLKREVANSDLDRCHGRYVNGQYRYHVTNEFPYYMGCFKGELPRAVPRMMDMFTVCNETSGFEKQFGGYLCACQGQSPLNRPPMFRPGPQSPGLPFPPGMPEQQRQQILTNQLREEQQQQQLMMLRRQQMMANGQVPVVSIGNNGLSLDPRQFNQNQSPQVPLTIIRNGGQVVGNGQPQTGQLPGMVSTNGQPGQFNGMIVGNGQTTPTMVLFDRNGVPVEQRTGTGLGTGTLAQMPEQLPNGPRRFQSPMINDPSGLRNPQVGVAITQDGEKPILLNANQGVPMNGESIDTPVDSYEGTRLIPGGENLNAQRSGTGLGMGILGQRDQPNGQLLNVERPENGLNMEVLVQNGQTVNGQSRGTGLGSGSLVQMPGQLPNGPRRFQSPMINIPSGFRKPQVGVTNEENIDTISANAQRNFVTPQMMQPPFIDRNVQLQQPNQVVGLPSNMPFQGRRFEGLPGQDGQFRGMPGQGGPFRGMPGQDGPFRQMQGQGGPFRGMQSQGGSFSSMPGRGMRVQNGPFNGRPGQGGPFSQMTTQTDSSAGVLEEEGPLTQNGQFIASPDMGRRGAFTNMAGVSGSRPLRRRQNGPFRGVSVNALRDRDMPSMLGSTSTTGENGNKPDMMQGQFRGRNSSWNKRSRIMADNGPYGKFSMFNMYLQ